MDAIADPTFQHTKVKSSLSEETPSLLTVIIDITPKLWTELDQETEENGSLISVLKSLIVFLNAHLAFNSSNQVAVIASHSQGIKYLYPQNTKGSDEESSSKTKDLSIINKDMYRRFRNVDETLVEELYTLFEKERDQIDKFKQKSTLSGAMSAGLTYINRLSRELEAISLKSRLMVLTCGGKGESKDEIFQYIPIMNCIFSANKIKCPIDVVKIGGSERSTFLQQTTDATNGVYLHVESSKGLIQYLSTAMFIDPSLRQIIVKPNHGSVDFRTSCYLTGKVVAIGYICSVCLCVLSIIPPGNKCPACDSEFDEHVIAKLKKKPVIGKVTNRVTKKPTKS
ncbi:TFIIH/NER complex subunit TFB4 NDAI_0A05260 [Naumovozyma dairenensis CBS 421]|uniref:General transcription and DNA repair factor IIH subunit TFB4 n=1 Tax=Naumovozyma dairenensis (strain ATCC 10597 / BCRC 20456 / CBS 421 / NBRC 0211 / NRRL Y-12639) TaxID=1071378 RepID=G0W4E3_NAUDC|nr:hypothetical protein NDAI_0A05260 [Naumovozyma dairenensis CBS 421]CCD22681.1 hypothetical protein NDAI_0A05260 [Naumovozyma dairenensis CBS 421]